MDEPPHTAISLRARHGLGAFVGAVGVIASVTGAAVLIGGWGLGVSALKSVAPGFSTMAPVTAVAIAALGFTLAVQPARTKVRSLSMIGPGVALAVGVVTLLGYAFQLNLYLDRWVPAGQETSVFGRFPGRPSAATAVMLILISVAALARHCVCLKRVKSAAAFAALFIAWTVLNVYVMGANSLREVAPFGSVAVHTAAACLLLGLGALAAEPTASALRLTLAKDMGGVVCRSLLPAAALAPPLLGWLLSHVAAAGQWPAALLWALYSVSSSVGLVTLILALALRIALLEAERARAMELSLRDALTGIPNRRAFDLFLTKNLAAPRTHDHTLSLLMLDVDCFKSYNDTFGHPAGDELLKSLASLLRTLVRETDLVARVGGEEFAVVLPGTGLEGACVFAERIRAEVECCRDSVRPISVSIGVASVAQRMAGLAALLCECDAALYQAKRAGRNRVSCCERLPARALESVGPAFSAGSGAVVGSRSGALGG